MQLLQILSTLVVLVMTCIALPAHDDANSQQIQKKPGWPLDGKSIEEQARTIRKSSSHRNKKEDVRLLELYENYFRTVEPLLRTKHISDAAHTNLNTPFLKDLKEFHRAYIALLSQMRWGRSTIQPYFAKIFDKMPTDIGQKLRAHRAAFWVGISQLAQSPAFELTSIGANLKRLAFCDLWEISKKYIPEVVDPWRGETLETYLINNAPFRFNHDTDCDDTILGDWMQPPQLSNINPEQQEEPTLSVKTRPSLWDHFKSTRLWKFWEKILRFFRRLTSES